MKLKGIGADGQEAEFEIPDEQFEQQYVPFAKHNATMAELRTAAKGKKSADEFLADPEFQKTAREKLGLKESGKAPTADELQKARQAWEAESLTPLEKKLQEAAERVTRLNEQRLEGRILQEAARVGVKKFWLQPDTEGGVPRIVKLLRGEFVHAEEHDEFFQRDAANAAGLAFSTNGKYGKPYRGVGEFFDVWAADKNNAEILEDQRQRGAGFGQASPAGQGMAEAEFQKLSPTERLKRARSQGFTK
jgi:hypothetical protein